MSEAEQRFHKLLGLLAARCDTELDVMEIEIYDRQLAKFGYAAVNTALEGILVDRAPGDKFPTVGTILSRLGVQSTPKALAMDVTNRIVGAIHSKGYNWSDKVRDFEADQLRVLGEAGLAVVKRLGGWAAVIEFANGNPSHYRAWIRDSAVAVIEASGGKLLHLPPAESRPQLTDKTKNG